MRSKKSGFSGVSPDFSLRGFNKQSHNHMVYSLLNPSINQL